MANRFFCPCCDYQTLDQKPPGSFAVCPVCAWIDDSLQFTASDSTEGANPYSLNQSRDHFAQFGASTRDALGKVRPPRPDEPHKPPRKGGRR